MRRAHTVEQVREAEEALMRTLPEGVLMQRAATGLAHAVLDLLGGGYGRRVVLLVGAGNNGGDALHAGARLARRGVAVEAWLLADQVHDGGLAALRAAGGTVAEPHDVVADAETHGVVDLVVDGIVGIGGTPGLRPAAAAALEHLPGVPVVAVDTPSGIGVDTGELDGNHVTASLTVTFGTHKVGHLVDPAAAACGAIHLVDIGLDLPDPVVESLQPPDVRRLLPRPQGTDHKYTRGVVGVRAGSATYPGAATLCVAGAMAGPAGMVRCVGEVADAVRQAHPEVVGEGRVQAWVVGPGGGEGAAAELEAAADDGVPLVVDADALTHVTGPLPVPVVLTPHAGELAAMTGVARADVEARPLAHARAAAERFGAVVLLKGRHTLVAEPGRPVRVTTTGVPWLATAGAGDVLAGLIGSLLAAGLPAYDAASVGSWVHGAAATLASRGGPLTAGLVAETLPETLRHVLSGGMEESRE
ncbi:bifunctional ADP-dependent NAD(P)H-hydrate dehydratase/NAD(P)H-hydrate epimerase [Nocardioides coralli]|uniref:bifunctional ADP-dependent NAD(P)H-hydrate dehydratase/NAD(P)H-hydrate epimerase n=1 Tax=Nocardioides coralli TaxID=2872154 RepID=UPI001CA3B60B|nr:bifunctional ADP-dependent NAD(P)H-hydrate dehydratase/NAD(P)H-hydrate epimerase [Nocardioides coralli]QZY28566.1 bifunctional ADP-dependent NAD(P)H-hydrate dehydratase/NAD(P)H-hydrate epimerase [Nocardioides coralli]